MALQIDLNPRSYHTARPPYSSAHANATATSPT